MADGHPETMKIRTALWSAAAKLPPFYPDSKAAASLPHSKLPSAHRFSKQSFMPVRWQAPRNHEIPLVGPGLAPARPPQGAALREVANFRAATEPKIRVRATRRFLKKNLESFFLPFPQSG